VFNSFQSIKFYLLGLINKNLETFTCSCCKRLLDIEDKNLSHFDKQDSTICIDCWESKYREEIFRYNEQYTKELIDLLKLILDNDNDSFSD
jgi:hypothetical protein